MVHSCFRVWKITAKIVRTFRFDLILFQLPVACTLMRSARKQTFLFPTVLPTTHPSTAYYYNNNDNGVRLLATKSWTIPQLPFVHVYYYNSSYNNTANTIKREKAESSTHIYIYTYILCTRATHICTVTMYVQFGSNKLLILKWKYSFGETFINTAAVYNNNMRTRGNKEYL